MAAVIPHLLLLFLLLPVRQPLGAVVTLELTVQTAFMALDGTRTEVVVANGQLPGPAAYLTIGDTLRLVVHNRLNAVSISLHCHGFINGNNSWNDGVGQVTQCPINGYQSFTYILPSTGQRGTYWWHEHHVVMRAYGLYGPVIIRDPADPILAQFQYTAEEVLMIGDAYHRDWSEVYTGLLQDTASWVWAGDPEAILHNGRGCYRAQNSTSLVFDINVLAACYANTVRRSLNQSLTSGVGLLYVWDVQPSTVYRLRLIGVGGLSIVTFAIQDHNLTVVEVDGHDVEPYDVSSLEVNSGQRYSVIVRTLPLSGPAAFWMVSTAQFRTQVAAAGVLRYPGAVFLPSEDDLHRTHALTVSLPSVDWRRVAIYSPDLHDPILNQFIARQMAAVPPTDGSSPPGAAVPTATRTLYFTTYQANAYADGSVCTPWAPSLPAAKRNCRAGSLVWMVWAVNNTPMQLGDTPLLLTVAASQALPAHNVYELQAGDVVDVVLQNGPALNGVAEQHPWHLHGHSFWLLGQGPGTFDLKNPPTPNTAGPSVRDTVTAFPFSWTWLRFVADNPGVWLFHCHIEWHLHMGMGVVFVERRAEIQPPSPATPLCGAVSRADFAPADDPSQGGAAAGLDALAIGCIVLGSALLLVLGGAVVGVLALRARYTLVPRQEEEPCQSRAAPTPDAAPDVELQPTAAPA
eukprot:EG_transcript_5507